MRKEHDILHNAISDCGYWRWWTAKLPASFQVEFGGVQLYQGPSDPSLPPSGVFALRFEQPEQIEFLDFGLSVQRDWFGALQREEFEAPTLSRENFALGDSDAAEAIRRRAVRAHVHYAGTPRGSPIVVAFQAAGQIGLFVAAGRLRLFSHNGEIQLEDVSRLHGDWWDYWRRYWDLKETPKELPEDYACEATIPAGD